MQRLNIVSLVRKARDLFFSVLAQNLQHLVNSRLHGPQQRLVHQIRQENQRCPDHLAGTLSIERPCEYRHLSERCLFFFRQQVPGVVEDSPKAAMALRHVAQRGLKNAEAVFDIARYLLAGDHPGPQGRQLDAQRHATQKLAYPHCPGPVLIRENEAGLRPPNGLQEQLNSVEIVGILCGCSIGIPHAIYLDQPLKLQIEPFASGDHQLHAWGLPENVDQQVDPLHHVIEAVQHQ